MVELLQPKHLKEAVKGLHWRNSSEIHRLLRDNEDFIIPFNDSGEDEGKVDVERMLGMLPLHLIAVLMEHEIEDRIKFRYVLFGIRLSQTFYDLTNRHPKLEQMMLDNMEFSAQMIDLVILIIIMIGGRPQDSDNESLVQATLTASSLHLLNGIISPNSQDVVRIMLILSKVDIFIDSAFGAIHNVVRSLRKKLLTRRTDNISNKLRVKLINAVNFHCQQAEASLQFLHSLCLHKPFRDRIAKNKELCGKGGVLMLAQTILSLGVTPEFVGATVALASISRMKAKVLSILQHLFEAESVSFLDDVVSAGNLSLAQNIASEVLELLRIGLSKASKASASPEYPMGFVLLNSMRLADVLTDDSNFRSFFTERLSTVLSAVFCLAHGDFLSMLCSSDLSSREDDATLDYDYFTSAEWVIKVISSSRQPPPPQFRLNFQTNLAMASYAHQRTSLVIKMIANLHCFVPNVCQEQDRNRFIRNFMSGLKEDPSSVLPTILPNSSYTPLAQRGTGVCRNLCSLLRHAESLIPSSLNEEDFMLLRVFCDQLQPLIRSEFEESEAQVQDNSSGQQESKETLNLNNEEVVENSDVQVEVAVTTTKTEQDVKNEEEKGEITMKETDDYYALNFDKCSLETSGSDSGSNRGKSPVNQVEDEGLVRKSVKEDEKAEISSLLLFEQQRKKRKRSIMNEEQLVIIEKALADEPDMQRKSASIQFWADRLSQNGSEVITSSQLKNWLNNRKAKLARANKQTGSVRDTNSSGDLPESPGDENTAWQQQKQPSPFKDQTATSSSNPIIGENPNPMKPDGMLKQGQHVMLLKDESGVVIGKGTVCKKDGEWYGLNLEERQVCVVDVFDLIGDDGDWSKMIPYGSDDVGKTFGEAHSRFGVVRVAWDVNKLQFHH